MKSKKAKYIIEILEVNGFIYDRQKGSHVIYKNDNKTVVVPYHGSNKEIKVGTVLSIIKQSGLDKELFDN